MTSFKDRRANPDGTSLLPETGWLRQLAIGLATSLPYVRNVKRRIDEDAQKIETLKETVQQKNSEIQRLTVEHIATFDELVASDRREMETLRREIETLKQSVEQKTREARILSVGHGATFDELETAGRAGGGTPYRFDELASLISGAPVDPPDVPPLIFLHVPKCGGTTMNNILMKNYRYRVDSYGNAFFPRYFPDEFVYLAQAPGREDTRRPVFFTGHFDIENDIFRYMPTRYVAITMLRDPVRRIISHYRFHASLPNSAVGRSIIEDDLTPTEYLDRYRSIIPLQFELFAPRTDGEAAEEAQGDRVKEALRNLEERISVYGFLEQHDDFVVQLAAFLGLPDTNYVRALNQTPAEAPDVPEIAAANIESLRDVLAHDIAFYEGARALYEERCAALPFDLDARVADYRAANDAAANRRRQQPENAHPWIELYS
jgi:hypothetical protein